MQLDREDKSCFPVSFGGFFCTECRPPLRYAAAVGLCESRATHVTPGGSVDSSPVEFRRATSSVMYKRPSASPAASPPDCRPYSCGTVVRLSVLFRSPVEPLWACYEIHSPRISG